MLEKFITAEELNRWMNDDTDSSAELEALMEFIDETYGSTAKQGYQFVLSLTHSPSHSMAFLRGFVVALASIEAVLRRQRKRVN